MTVTTEDKAAITWWSQVHEHDNEAPPITTGQAIIAFVQEIEAAELPIDTWALTSLFTAELLKVSVLAVRR